MNDAWKQYDGQAAPPEEGMPPAPGRVFLELTSRCNMSCRFCPSPVLERPRQDMPRELVEKALKEIAGTGIPLTFHVMGEPLLNRHFLDYARLCDGYDIPYWLVTNGALFNKDTLDALFGLKKLLNLEISFHTPDPESFRLRGAVLSFEAYLERIRMAIFSAKRYEAEKGLSLDIMYDLHLGGVWRGFSLDGWRAFVETALGWKKELEALYPDARECYPRFFTGKKRVFQRNGVTWWRDVEDMPKTLFAELPPDAMWLGWELFPKVFVNIKKFFFFGKTDAYLNHALGGRVFEVRPADNFSCSWSGDLAVLSNGAITFCCMDYEGELSCGNIRNMTLAEAAASARRREVMRHPAHFAFCRRCRGELILPPCTESGRPPA